MVERELGKTKDGHLFGRAEKNEKYSQDSCEWRGKSGCEIHSE